MKIVHITEPFSGGVYYSVRLLSEEFARLGCKVLVMYGPRGDLRGDGRAQFKPEIQLTEVGLVRELSLISDLRAFLRLAKELKDFKPDVIHLHSSKAGFLGRIAAKFVCPKSVVFYSPRGLSFLQKDRALWVRRIFILLERVAALFGGVIVACSRSEYDCVKSHLGNAQVVLVENAVVMDYVSRPCRKRKYRVGTVGRVVPQKNPELFASIAKRMCECSVEFVWIGGGDDPVKLAELTDAGVRVTGWMPRNEVLSQLSSIDVYLQTSLWEGMPLSLIESQLLGLPAVVTDVVGNRDVVLDGITGVVCKSETEIIDAINRLIADAQYYCDMSNNAVKLARSRFAVERLVNELRDVYNTELLAYGKVI